MHQLFGNIYTSWANSRRKPNVMLRGECQTFYILITLPENTELIKTSASSLTQKRTQNGEIRAGENEFFGGVHLKLRNNKLP